MIYYPSNCFCKNETHTMQRKKEYERKQKALDRECEKIDPNYFNLPLRDRYNIRCKAENNIF